MRATNTSSGGSSGKTFPDSLPSGAAQIFECMSPLDKDWFDDKLGLFSALSTSGNPLVDIDFPVQDHSTEQRGHMNLSFWFSLTVSDSLKISE
jgi:hypothetical protein